MATDTSMIAQRPQPWFQGAPISRAITVSTIISFVLIEVKNAHDAMAMDVNQILQHGQFYRLITGHLTFGTGGELIMGTAVLAQLMRRFEREFGSQKFATFLFLTNILAMALEILSVQFVPQQANIHYSGPYPWIGALLWLFHIYTPRMYPRFFGILGFNFSENSITYAFVLTVVCNGWLTTIIPTVCGVMSGFLMSTPKLPFLSRMEPPRMVCTAISAMFGERFGSSTPPILMAGGAPRRGGGRARGVAARGGGVQPRPPVMRAAAPPPPPSDAVVEQLTSMGFDRESVLRALRESDNNVERAADRLLTGL